MTKSMWDPITVVDERPTVYFAHPMRTYGTEESLKVFRALSRDYKDYRVIDPEDLDAQPVKDCRQCMDEHMKKVFFPLIDKCAIIFIWAPLSTCGIKCELFYAWEHKKPAQLIVLQDDELEYEDLSLKEYHYMDFATEVL